MFQKPKKFDFEVKEKKAELYALLIADKIRKYKWNNKKPTAQMLEDGSLGILDIKLCLRR